MKESIQNAGTLALPRYTATCWADLAVASQYTQPSSSLPDMGQEVPCCNMAVGSPHKYLQQQYGSA